MRAEIKEALVCFTMSNVIHQLVEPLLLFLTCLERFQESDKRFEKARGSYETAINKVKGLNDKAKVNLAKLTEVCAKGKRVAHLGQMGVRKGANMSPLAAQQSLL